MFFSVFFLTFGFVLCGLATWWLECWRSGIHCQWLCCQATVALAFHCKPSRFGSSFTRLLRCILPVNSIKCPLRPYSVAVCRVWQTPPERQTHTADMYQTNLLVARTNTTDKRTCLLCLFLSVLSLRWSLTQWHWLHNGAMLAADLMLLFNGVCVFVCGVWQGGVQANVVPSLFKAGQLLVSINN